ncbi:fumarylacetoacetate hydrolase family protein [Curtobacterium flaccumfaciens]|nr:fumarylacetoacetate hydrolase family protein [Curtobacterium flaccumfaciens]
MDGELRQAGDLADQIWSVAETIAAVSRSVSLAPGDLLMTGTPRRRRRARTRLGAHRHDRRCRRGPDPDRLSHVSPMCRRAGSLRRQHG